MHPISCVSYPRSGHHMLVRLLTGYFGDALHYCEYYEHCQQSPCSDPLTNFQKNHDFDLALPNDAGRRYIIQYRHPVTAIISWFELALKNGWKHDVREDTRECFARFLRDKMQYWRGFVRKWVIDNDHPATVVLPYVQFSDQPESHFRQVLELIAPGHPVDEKLLVASLDHENVRRKRNPADFRHFDPRACEAAEGSAAQEMRLLELPSILQPSA